MGQVKLELGDCLDVLKTLDDASIDAVVTDPPYGLSFMGKAWDYDVPSVAIWQEVLRVLKPGGYLLSFAGTRTQHRMAVAIEDAGFEIRDMIAWVYGSGFPKSLNIGKAVDKLQGNEREVVGKEKGAGTTGDNQVGNQTFVAKNQYEDGTHDITKGTSEWEGWGTALKPALEPITVARKPLEGTVAENCLKWGVGGINIDESRVETSDDLSLRYKSSFQEGNSQFVSETATGSGKRMELEEPDGTKLGRFPANLIHDGSEEVVGLFPNDSARFFKSIITDKLCTLCCLPFDIKHDTMSVCKNTNVSSAEKSFKTTQATTESIALKNATGQVNKNFVQNVKSAGNLCDLCGTSIAQRLVAIMQDPGQESTLGELSMPEHKKQILEKCLVSFVELRGNTDTIPTMENLSLLFGYVSNAIEEYTQKCEDIRNEEKNQWKSLVYRSKASKSERNMGCEGMEEKEGIRTNAPRENEDIKTPTRANHHPTVKPIALMEYLVNMVSREGHTILDPFMGSGSTGIACTKLGRDFIGIEREAEYLEIAKARIAAVPQRLL